MWDISFKSLMVLVNAMGEETPEMETDPQKLNSMGMDTIEFKKGNK